MSERPKRTKEGALTERVAMLLLGTPSGIDPAKGKVRFADIVVDYVTGRFYDLEEESGGDHLDLIRQFKRVENGHAEAWLEENVTKAPKQLPPEQEHERLLLGMLAVQPHLMGAIEEDVTVDDFSLPEHKLIFQAIQKFSTEADDPRLPMPITDLLAGWGGDALAPVMGATGFNAATYIGSLMARAPDAPDAAHMARSLAVNVRSNANRDGDIDDQYDLEPEPEPFESTMGLQMWADQEQPGQEYEFLIEDLIPEKQIVMLIGESGSGKSFLTFDMAMAMARGVPFMGRRILHPVGVIWCAFEAGEGASQRMRAYRRYNGLSLDPLPFAALRHPVPLWPNEPAGDLLLKEVEGITATQFRGVPLGAIIVDTYNAATPGASEIDSEVVSRIRGYFRRLVEATGATIIIIGHTNAAGKHRGNEQLTNNVDTIIKVTMKTILVGKDQVQMKNDDGRPIRTMQVTKQREGEKGWEVDFVLHSVKDGTIDKFGKERTACVVVPHEGAIDNREHEAVAKGPRLSHERTVILQALRSAIEEHGETTPPLLKLPRSIARVVNVKFWKQCYLQKMTDVDTPTDNTVNKRLRDASAQFQNLRLIGRVNPFVWIVPGKSVQETNTPEPEYPPAQEFPEEDD